MKQYRTSIDWSGGIRLNCHVLRRAWLLVSVVWCAFNVAMIAIDSLWLRWELWILAAAPFLIPYILQNAIRYVVNGNTRPIWTRRRL
jgi:hypothetical protein